MRLAKETLAACFIIWPKRTSLRCWGIISACGCRPEGALVLRECRPRMASRPIPHKGLFFLGRDRRLG